MALFVGRHVEPLELSQGLRFYNGGIHEVIEKGDGFCRQGILTHELNGVFLMLGGIKHTTQNRFLPRPVERPSIELQIREILQPREVAGAKVIMKR